MTYVQLRCYRWRDVRMTGTKPGFSVRLVHCSSPNHISGGHAPRRGYRLHRSVICAIFVQRNLQRINKIIQHFCKNARDWFLCTLYTKYMNQLQGAECPPTQNFWGYGPLVAPISPASLYSQQYTSHQNYCLVQVLCHNNRTLFCAITSDMLHKLHKMSGTLKCL